MRGLAALLLILALVSVSGAGPSLHTHAYSGHDHPEHHHHGLAAHQHATPAPHTHEGASRVQDCSPATHAVEFAVVSVAATQGPDFDAVFTVGPVPEPEPSDGRWVCRVDPRVHGPPSRSLASPRAPPPVALA